MKRITTLLFLLLALDGFSQQYFNDIVVRNSTILGPDSSNKGNAKIVGGEFQYKDVNGNWIKPLDSAIKNTDIKFNTVASGTANAFHNTVPDTNIKSYYGRDTGIYTSFLDTSGAGIHVFKADLDSGIVMLYKIGTGWYKSVQKQNLVAYVNKSSDIVSGITLITDQLFDKNTYLANTYVNTSGIVVTSPPTTNNYRTMQITVDPALSNITVSGLTTTAGVAHRYSFYNASGSFISGSYGVGNTAVVSLTIPATAKTFNLTYQHGTLDDSTAGNIVMVNYGITALPYASYTPVNAITKVDNKSLTASLIKGASKTQTIDYFLSTTLQKSDLSYKVGTNLFDKSDTTLKGKILTSSGTGYATEANAMTVRIPLSGTDTSLYVSGLYVNTLVGSKYYRFVNSSGSLVAGSVGFMSSSNKQISIPVSAAFFEITWYRTTIDSSISNGNTIMINYGTVPLLYNPYVKVISSFAGYKADPYIQPKTAFTTLLPSKIYTICNDIVDYGSASEYKYNRNYSTVLYMDRFFNLQSRLFDAKIDGTQNDKYPVSAPYDVTSGTIVYNNGNNYNTETKSFKIVSNTIADVMVSFSNVSTKASVLKNKKISFLAIGDSNTDGTRSVLIGTPDSMPARYYDAAAYLAEMDRVDAGLPANDYLFKNVGSRNRRDMLCVYKNANTPISSFAEGWPSWSAADFLYRTDHRSQAQGTWDLLGLGNGTGTDFTASTAQLLLLNTTAEGKNTPTNTAAFISYMNDLYGGITTYSQAAAKADSLLNNPINPFFDRSKAGSTRFSFSKYMDRYKTLANDGTTRLVVGSNAGTRVTDATAWDLYKPTHIGLYLGTNDFYGTWYLPTIDSLIADIKNYDSTIIVLVGLIDASGTYWPEFYPGYENVSLYNNYGFHNKAYQVNRDLMTIDNPAKKIFYDPSYFIQPTAEGTASRSVPDAADILGTGIQTDFETKYGKAPEQHVNNKAHIAKGYQLLSLLYFTKQYMP